MMFHSAKNVSIRDPTRDLDVPKFSFVNPILLLKPKEGKSKTTVIDRARRLYDERLSKTVGGQWLFMVYNTGW